MIWNALHHSKCGTCFVTQNLMLSYYTAVSPKRQELTPSPSDASVPGQQTTLGKYQRLQLLVYTNEVRPQIVNNT